MGEMNRHMRESILKEKQTQIKESGGLVVHPE